MTDNLGFPRSNCGRRKMNNKMEALVSTDAKDNHTFLLRKAAQEGVGPLLGGKFLHCMLGWEGPGPFFLMPGPLLKNKTGLHWLSFSMSEFQ